MPIWSTLWNVIKDLLPFLKSAAQKFFDGLPEKTQAVLKDSAKLSQILKETYKEGYDAFIVATMDQLGFDKDKTDEILMEIAKSLNIDINAPNEFFDKIQAYIDTIRKDETWDNLFANVAQFAALFLSEGRFKFSTLLYGVMQFVFDKFIKAKI